MLDLRLTFIWLESTRSRFHQSIRPPIERRARRLKVLTINPRIRCSICRKHKNVDLYSKKQLLELKHHIHLGFEMKNSPIRCRNCTACQNHEMTCSICNEVKGLDAFSKAQRRTPDKAACSPRYTRVWHTLTLYISVAKSASTSTWLWGLALGVMMTRKWRMIAMTRLICSPITTKHT